MKIYRIKKIEEWRDFYGHDSSETILNEVYRKKPQCPESYSYKDGGIDTDVRFEIIESELI